MEKIDCFAHVLLPGFKSKILEVAPRLPEQMPFINHPLLIDMEARRKSKYQGVKQVLSYVNTNPEDYLEPDQAIALVQSANQELVTLVSEQTDIYAGAVAMLALNNISGSVKIIKEEVARNPFLLGIQLFTRHLGKSLAHPDFKPIFQICAELDIPIWLHPVFDTRKPDNNIIFSWEYEQTQAMLQVVQARYFQEFPNLKIIVHHAGAMAPYFAERINHILPIRASQIIISFSHGNMSKRKPCSKWSKLVIFKNFPILKSSSIMPELWPPTLRSASTISFQKS